MKRLIISIFAVALSLPLFAVTKEEMEQARTIAAQCYLRWSNNGSGYLDEHNPKTMAELEKVLKDKEKQNLKSFKAVATPSDYASWDKDKLVQYWSQTFFSSPGLDEEGRKARHMVNKRVKAMTVTAPKVEEKPAEATPETKAETPTAEQPTEQSAQAAAEKVEATAASVEEQIAAEEELAEKSAKKKSSGTWIYVMILCILVGVVVWLVVFASKTMKQQEEQRRKEARRRRLEDEGMNATPYEPAPVAQVDKPVEGLSEGVVAELGELRSRVATLTARLEQSEAASERLIMERDEAKRKCVTLQIEMENLTARLERAEQDRDRAVAAAKNVREAGSATAASTVAPAVPRPQYVPREAPRKPEVTLFMGRVNNSGIFVRAERQLNPEQSVYRLVTSDGKTASFSVCEDPEVASRALGDPMVWLANGSTARDLTDTRGRREIVTEKPGEAVLDDGKWRVTRKAQVRYV